MIQTDIQDNIAICSLNRGVTNPLNASMIQLIHDELDKLGKMQDIHGVILSSSNSKFYSIGLDIPELFPLSPEEFTEFFQNFSQLCVKLLSFPKPVITIISGHTIAGGCILALACDYRYAKKDNFKMGLNEIKLGVPVPYIAECILKDLIGIHKTRYVCETGDFFLPERLLTLGLIDEIVAQEDLQERAISKINQVATNSLDAFSKIKEIRNEQILERFNKNYQRTTQEFVDLWYSPLTRARLLEAMAKF
ncbi:MAG: enoyl-CoA hydratase/isomerase family protein [Candidatus Hodarchaeales archaeon]|jgi:enoyl-CoA hydratase/carnithine racemase